MNKIHSNPFRIIIFSNYVSGLQERVDFEVKFQQENRQESCWLRLILLSTEFCSNAGTIVHVLAMMQFCEVLL